MTTATTVRERPIIFSRPMVNVILAGKKTMTRRVLKPQPNNPTAFGISPVWGSGTMTADTPGVKRGTIPRSCVGRHCIHAAFSEWGERVDRWLPCPYGKVGDHLWTREAWRLRGWRDDDDKVQIEYRAGGLSDWINAGDDGEAWIENATRNLPDGYEEDADLLPWRSPIHLPRWASRITLEITGLRVERADQISREDVRAEGVPETYGECCPEMVRGLEPHEWDNKTAQEQFAHVWDRINGRGSWALRPFVWCMEFRLLDPAKEGM